MSDESRETSVRPPCSAEVGYRGHPGKCGEPSRYGLVDGDGTGTMIYNCEDHAWDNMDHTGSRIAVDFDQDSN